jgi:hypothetical protein
MRKRKNTRETLAAQGRVNVEGIESPVMVRQADDRQVELFLNYPLSITMDDLDYNAAWSGPRRMKLADVTRVDFDGGYERALAVTAPKRSKAKR